MYMYVYIYIYIYTQIDSYVSYVYLISSVSVCFLSLQVVVVFY